MPFTEKARKFFHAAAARGQKGMSKLADEADAYAKAGEELPPKHPDEEKKHEPWKRLSGEE